MKKSLEESCVGCSVNLAQRSCNDIFISDDLKKNTAQDVSHYLCSSTINSPDPCLERRRPQIDVFICT